MIEDSPSARKLLQDLLIRLGVSLPDLRMASSFPAALQVYTQWRPDVVFVDLQLRPPDGAGAPAATANPANRYPKDGGELAIQLLQRTPSLKLVVCSAADPSESEVADLIAKGRVQSIVKPIVAYKVKAVLESLGVVLDPTTNAGRP